MNPMCSQLQTVSRWSWLEDTVIPTALTYTQGYTHPSWVGLRALTFERSVGSCLGDAGTWCGLHQWKDLNQSSGAYVV